MSLDLVEQPAAAQQPPQDSATLPAAPDAGAQPTETNELEDGLLLDEQQPDPDEVEEEFEGLKLRGKKDSIEKLKAERLMHADYTRKRQADAEERKSWQSERTASEQFEQEKFEFWNAQQRAQQLQQVDFAALRQANPELAESLRDELAKLSAVLPNMGQALAQKTQQRKFEAERASANRANESELIVAREVKDWGPEKFAKFVDAGQKAGIPPQALQKLLVDHPQVSRFINKALAYDQLLAQRLKAKAAAPAPKPVTRVGGGGASTTKSTYEMTTAEYAEQRRLRQKR